jgi:hypothetical protein
MKPPLLMTKRNHPMKVVSLQDLEAAMVRPKLLRISSTRDTQRIQKKKRLVEMYSESMADESGPTEWQNKD